MVFESFGKELFSLLYPARCLGCEEQLYESVSDQGDSQPPETNDCYTRQTLSFDTTNWCPACIEEIAGDLIDRCYSCGAQIRSNNQFGKKCRLCVKLDLRLDRAICVGNYRGLLQELVIRMKREKSDVLAIQLGRLTGQLIPKFEVPEDVDFLVPVPMSWSRKFTTGFQASAVIAKGIRMELGTPKVSSVIRCLRKTKKQGRLSTTARFANVKGAFEISARADVKNKSILLVDDVMTSGATLSEIAKLLKRSGAKEVFAAVIARGARVS